MKSTFYSKYGKRVLDVVCASLALIVFCWLYAILSVLVKVKHGSPILYSTDRVGKDGKIFKLYKFRSMTNERDENGILLKDKDRLTKFGRIIRATSLDELPEAWNILIGDMSVIGPRPLPEKYIKYYTAEERHRLDVRPGLSGWAQVHGRNNLSWDKKFALDVWYAEHVSFFVDIKTVVKTVVKTIKREGIGQGEEMPISLYVARADWILTEKGAINPNEDKQVCELK